MASILKVDQIQLPDGSAPTASDLGISQSALTSADMPAGSVLQVVSNDFATKTQTTSTAYIATPVAITVTPKKANSAFKVEVVTTVASYASVSTLGLVIKRSDGVHSPLGSGGHGLINSPDGATQAFYTGPDGSTSNHMSPASIAWFDTSYGSLNPVTYTVHIASNGTSGTVTLGGLGNQPEYDTRSIITVTEIAQ